MEPYKMYAMFFCVGMYGLFVFISSNKPISIYSDWKRDMKFLIMQPAYSVLVLISLIGYFLPIYVNGFFDLPITPEALLISQYLYMGVCAWALTTLLTYLGVDTTKAFHTSSLIVTTACMLISIKNGFVLLSILILFAGLYSGFRAVISWRI